MIIKGKWLYATRMKNRQFLSSKEAQQSPDGKEFECIDGIFVKTLMPDLSFGEGFRHVDLRIETKEFPGSHQMWVAGKFRHRFLTEEKPDYDGDDRYLVAGGDSLYLSITCREDFFPRMSECIFPVWVSCTKGEPYDEDDYFDPLHFEAEGNLDMLGDKDVFFDCKPIKNQVQEFLKEANITMQQCPVRCKLILEIEQRRDD
jgi:hypothetical protein